jgi:hypothetical protein
MTSFPYGQCYESVVSLPAKPDIPAAVAGVPDNPQLKKTSAGLAAQVYNRQAGLHAGPTKESVNKRISKA